MKRAIKRGYVSLENLTEMPIGGVEVLELPTFNKVQSAKVMANTLKNRGVGEWSIHLVTKNVVEVTRKA